jgi:predicted enzyme related to lactoylglutathione lyase
VSLHSPSHVGGACNLFNLARSWIIIAQSHIFRHDFNLAAGVIMSAPIVYFEVAGPDGGKLCEFYSAVFGWEIDASSTISPASTGGLKGGIRQDPAEKVLYLGVPDIAESLKQIEAAGGKTVMPRTVIPGVVTFALFTDPAGNRMGLAEFGSYPG